MEQRRETRVVAFDADDTLWDCQSHFERVERGLYELIAPYCDNPAHELLYTERGNMADLGYGCKAFTISVVETALRVGGGRVPHVQLARLLEACKGLLRLPATPLPGVVETLGVLRERCSATGRRMVVFTKGELLDQENKLRRSGLGGFFDDVVIASDKSPREFVALCERLRIGPGELLMVGNSLRSDMAPALAVGAWGVYVPFHVTWQLERVEEFDHERMVRVERFSDLLGVV